MRHVYRRAAAGVEALYSWVGVLNKLQRFRKRKTNMNKIRLVTFKGCQSTVDLRTQLENLIDKESLDAKVEMVFVPAAGRAMEMGLFGSPTILINGVEVQPERRGPAGFY
jgi:hypothetical protein